MAETGKLILVRMLPVILITASAAVYVVNVEGPDSYAARNTMPMILLIALSAVTLRQGNGSWAGSGWCWPLGTFGYAVPALGLSLYLHYAYAVDLDGMFTGAGHPEALFRFLPAYTSVAGAIGFAIGWIAGRNI